MINLKIHLTRFRETATRLLNTRDGKNQPRSHLPSSTQSTALPLQTQQEHTDHDFHTWEKDRKQRLRYNRAFPLPRRNLLIIRDQLRSHLFHASNVKLEEKYSTTKMRIHLSRRFHAMGPKMTTQWTWMSCLKQFQQDQRPRPPSTESLGNEFHYHPQKSSATSIQ